MKRTWWDRWEDEMHFQHESSTPALRVHVLMLAALSSLAVLFMVGGYLLAK